ncbi:hypothetical protein Q9966_001664 [Columba livia]|nr:hypothetical protein Q9966_001664 [Columba livia]
MAKVRSDANINLFPCESGLGNVFLTFERVYEQEHGKLPQLNQWQLIKALQTTDISVVTNGHLILPTYREAGHSYYIICLMSFKSGKEAIHGVELHIVADIMSFIELTQSGEKKVCSGEVCYYYLYVQVARLRDSQEWLGVNCQEPCSAPVAIVVANLWRCLKLLSYTSQLVHRGLNIDLDSCATILTALIPMELLIKILQLDCVRLMKFYNILCAACMEEQIKSKLK